MLLAACSLGGESGYPSGRGGTPGGRSLIAERWGFKPLTDRDMKDFVEQRRLPVHEATYLELAVRQKLPLASRDEALFQAAEGCRVKLLL